MLAAIAEVLLVLWLLGFFAFHVSSGLIHVLLVIGIVLLVLHLMGPRSYRLKIGRFEKSFAAR